MEGTLKPSPSKTGALISSTLTAEKDPAPMVSATATSYLIAATDALQHLEHNLSVIEAVFANFEIPTSDYCLLAGFDEDTLKEQIGYLDQIHVYIRSEPPDKKTFLLELGRATLPFTAVVFMKGSTYRLPLYTSEFEDIALAGTRIFNDDIETAQGVLSFISLSENVAATGGTLDVGGSSGQTGQGGNQKKQPSRKGMEQEDPKRNAPGSNKEGVCDSRLESPSPNGGWTAEISFDIVSDLLESGQSKDTPPFQALQLKGTLMVARTMESRDDPGQFASCRVCFTELLSSSRRRLGTTYPTYHQSQLDVDMNSHTFGVSVKDIQPLTTQKYLPDSTSSKAGGSQLLSAALTAAAHPQATFGGIAGRSWEQATATEKTSRITRITQSAMRGLATWGFQSADPYDEERGITLSPERLPSARFRFIGTTDIPAQPPQHLTVEISSHWSLPRDGGDVWLNFKKKPTYSNICNIISLRIPSNLRGNHDYLHSGFGPKTLCRTVR